MKGNVGKLALFNFCIDFKLHSAILVLYFVGITHSYTAAMSLFAFAKLSSALFEIPTGIFSDKMGRKLTIIAGSVCAVVSSLLYAGAEGYAMLAVGAVFEGMSGAWWSGNNDALLYDSLAQVSEQDKYAGYLGKLSSFFQMALALGALLGSVIAQWSYGWMMWLSVIPQTVSFFVALTIHEPEKLYKKQFNPFMHLDSALKQLLRDRKLLFIGLRNSIGYAVAESAFNFRAAFIATLWPVWAIGISKMLSYIGATFSFWFSGKLIKKFGTITVLIYGDIYSRFMGIVAVVFPTVYSPLLLASTSLVFGVKDVAESDYMQKQFHPDKRATLGSLVSFFGSIFYGVYAVFLGMIADRINPAWGLLMGQFTLLPLLFLSAYMYWEEKKA